MTFMRKGLEKEDLGIDPGGAWTFPAVGWVNKVSECLKESSTGLSEFSTALGGGGRDC